MLLIQQQIQIKLFSKTDFVSITLSLVIASLGSLSRQDINTIFKHSIAIDYESLAKAQLKDEEHLNFLESNHSLKIKSVPVADTSFTLLYDKSISGKLRPLVPSRHRRTIFNSIHNLSHSGIKSTIQMIADRYVWLDMKNNVTFWCPTAFNVKKPKFIVTMSLIYNAIHLLHKSLLILI